MQSNLNLDFKEAISIQFEDVDWQASPEPTITRKVLERENSESGRATSIVRYQAGASFPHHLHPNGEELFVLQGVFSDESGDYSAGSYIRNPPGSGHRPFSTSGCLIFVKLAQMHKQENKKVIVKTQSSLWQPHLKNHYLFQELYCSETEKVQLIQLHPFSKKLSIQNDFGIEILVLEGELTANNNSSPSLTWLRFPAKQTVNLCVQSSAKFWMKTGHLL